VQLATDMLAAQPDQSILEQLAEGRRQPVPRRRDAARTAEEEPDPSRRRPRRADRRPSLPRRVQRRCASGSAGSPTRRATL
jgi:hypothetical protein